MPICKRDGFDNAPNKNKNETFHDNDEVFFCEVTKEIFRDYEDYFRHVMIINSTVWQCEATGRENLTYAEALKSERRARKKMELFKDSLRPVVMLVIDHAKQSSLNALNSIVFKFLRRRFFLNEEVTLYHKHMKPNAYTVVEILTPENTSPGANKVYENTDELQYKLRHNGKTNEVITVPFEKVRRQRFEFTLENLQMFIKSNVLRVDGILRPKPESYKKYVTERKITFSAIFIGKMPHFTPAKIKRPQEDSSKKQSTMNKYLVKSGDEGDTKMNAAQIAKREKERAEKLEAKAKSLKEEMERLRLEKQKRLAELERERIEKRAKLLERIDADCTALLTKTDDLERTDQLTFPTFNPVKTYVPTKIFGDAIMVREFIHSFIGILSGVEVFRGNLSFFEMSRAFSMREVAGPLSEIIMVFLRTIFDLQKEEEEECSVDYLKLRKEMRYNELLLAMSQAAKAHYYAKRHFSIKIHELPIDSFTSSEVLRLHLLSSGATVREKADKWRGMYRNGYTSSEDPGLQLRMQYPHILRALKTHTIYQLPFKDITRVLHCLMSQVLSYSSPINIMEERMEHMAKARYDLRALAIVENRRLASVLAQKRALTAEYNQQCNEVDVKNDQIKKRQLEEKLNKKISDLEAQSEREHKKYENNMENLNAALFNFLVYLGMDRAYRKYYVLESLPGLFVEHPDDCMDTCLSDPPQNALINAIKANATNLPKNRKDLRAYLLKLYTDEEKKEKKTNSYAKSKNICQDNKENHENGTVNGVANGHEHLPVDKEEEEKEEVNQSVTTEPTQYQLYMCTGDPRNCIVHDESNTDRQRWAYLYKKEDIDALIDSLNPLGERESQLRERLTTLHALILNHVKKCPSEHLTLDDKQMVKFKSVMSAETYRKYHNSNLGFSEDADLNEVMYSGLVERILQFESDIYTGDLGRLKVKDMQKWRNDVEQNRYDPQGKIQWGSYAQKQTNGTVEEEEFFDDCDQEEVDGDNDGGRYGNLPFHDPGEELGATENMDTDDSSDEGISLQDSTIQKNSVKNMASALLQVEQAIERRFIKEPFGAPPKEIKDKEFLERKMKCGAAQLKQWEASLMESESYSQVYLHLSILHDSILWARSTNKSSCQVCRRGSDPDKMLLCDECNGGTHMFCMKPKMKIVPAGNWYCHRCVKRLGLQNENGDNKKKATQKRKRAFIVDEGDNCSEASSSCSNNNERRASGRRTSKRLLSHEIEEELNDVADDNDEEKSEEELEEEECAVPDENSQNSESEEISAEDEDENVCIICSYDGGDLFCVRCKDVFHLECANLKRPPRYNFICTKCKSKDDKKRKSKTNDGSSSDDEDDQPLKRPRNARSSLRNSLPNDSTTAANSPNNSTNNNRRSNRRTGDNLPLNSSALYELLENVMKHEKSWPFLRPVMQSEVPDYYKIIKHPMDFAKVKSKLNMGQYQLNEELMNDIQLIFNNCDRYNAKGNEIYEAGATLEKYVVTRCKQLNLPFIPSDMSE